MFVHGIFQASLIFVSKADSNPCASSKDKILVLPTNVRLARKKIPAANTLAYLASPSETTQNVLSTFFLEPCRRRRLRPGDNLIKLFLSMIEIFSY